MQLTKEQSEIAEAFKLLTETYPQERIDLEVQFNNPNWSGVAVQHMAWVGSNLERVCAYGRNFMDAATNLIAKAGPRDPQAALKAKIAKAQEAMDAAKGELIKLQTEAKLAEVAS